MIPAPPLLAGDPSRLGRYTLLGRLGQGGMGVVYLGRDQGGPLVAIKVIRPELAANPDYLARFRREVELGRKVNGRFVAEVLDASFDSEWPFLVTAYIEGTTLQARVRERGPVPPSEVRQLAVGTAAALSAVHAAGLVHRDLKPGNVLLSAEGPRVIDFGVARAVRDRSGTSAVRPGTVEFMAPEQFDGAEAGAAADVFAWGGLLVYASSGRPPFGDKAGEGGVDGLERRVHYHQPDLGSLESPIRELVAAAMAKLPSGRPTAEALVARLLAGEPPATDDPASADDRQAAVERVRRRFGTGTAINGDVRRRPAVPPARLRLLVLVGVLAGAIALAWWTARGIAAHLGAILLVGVDGTLAISGLLGGGWALTRLARRRLDLAIALGMALLVATIGLPVSGYRGLNDRWWVAFDQQGLTLLKGAGPRGYGPFHVHNATAVERFQTSREDLPVLVAGMLDRGVAVRGRSAGRLAARCLPLLFTPVPGPLPAGGGDTSGPCSERLFDDPPGVPVPRQVTLPVATRDRPALVAAGGRVLLAWTGARDRRVRLRATTDGIHFGGTVTLQATAKGAPSLASDGTRVWVAWTGDDGGLAIASSADGERFGDATRLGRVSGSAPALEYGDGRLLIGWRDPDSNRLRLAVSLDGVRFGREVTLDETSDLAPTLRFADHAWVLAWIGRAGDQVNLLSSTDGEHFEGKTVLAATSGSPPALAAGGVWLLAWTRSQDGSTGLLVSRDGHSRFVDELRLDGQSAGPSMATFDGHVLLAWHERGRRPAVHLATIL